VSKDKNGVVTREVLTKKWSDWIDYWAVDFNYESKREIIRKAIVPEDRLPGIEADQMGLESYEEVWTGDYIFENEWQTFRTKKDRSLEPAQRGQGMPIWAAQDRGEGGGYFWQRHDDDCGSDGRGEGIMALHPKFPSSPYSILDPEIRWFPADEALRDTSADKLMPPLVPTLAQAGEGVARERLCGSHPDQQEPA
jgi:hypothetical protein